MLYLELDDKYITMNIREILDLMEDIEDSEPQVGDIVEMECGDTLIETTIAEITEDGVVLHLDETGVRILVDGAQSLLEGKTGPGLWANIHARRKSGKRMRKKGEEGAPTERALKAARAGSKNESVEDVAEGLEDKTAQQRKTERDQQRTAPAQKARNAAQRKGLTQDKDGTYYAKEGVAEDTVDEAKYQGREVPLGKPMKGDVAKSKVYVRGPKGNVVKVNFGQKGVKIKKNNPGRRKNFRARHNCDNPGPRWRARYWSCRAW